MFDFTGELIRRNCSFFFKTSCVSFDNANVNAITGKLKEFNESLEEVSKAFLDPGILANAKALGRYEESEIATY